MGSLFAVVVTIHDLGSFLRMIYSQVHQTPDFFLFRYLNHQRELVENVTPYLVSFQFWRQLERVSEKKKGPTFFFFLLFLKKIESSSSNLVS
jgi:hypothetical protein